MIVSQLLIHAVQKQSPRGGCYVKEVFLEISQYSQENTCARVSFLITLLAAPATLLKKRLWHRCFPVNFEKFIRTPFLQNTSGGCFWTWANFKLVISLSCKKERGRGLQTTKITEMTLAEIKLSNKVSGNIQHIFFG